MVQHPLIVVMLLFTLSACHSGKKVKIFFLILFITICFSINLQLVFVPFLNLTSWQQLWIQLSNEAFFDFLKTKTKVTLTANQNKWNITRKNTKTT